MNEIASKFRADFESGLTYWDTDPAPSSDIKLAENSQTYGMIPSPQPTIRALQLTSPKHLIQESVHPMPAGVSAPTSTIGRCPTAPARAEMLDPVEAIVRAAAISQPQPPRQQRTKVQELLRDSTAAVASATDGVFLSSQQGEFRQHIKQDPTGVTVNNPGAGETPLPPSAVARQSLMGLVLQYHDHPHHPQQHPQHPQ